MTFHRLMIALALLAAGFAMRVYLPEQSEDTLAAAKALISEQEYALPEEAAAWLDWR